MAVVHAGFRDFGGIVRPVHGDVAGFNKPTCTELTTRQAKADIWVQVLMVLHGSPFTPIV